MLFCRKPINKRNLLYLVFLVGLIVPAVITLIRPGFFPTDDGEWMVIRLSDFHRSIVSGQIPVRWASRLNFGYGYPVFNFLYPLSLYFGEIFHVLGFSFVDSIKLVFIASFFFGGFFMYYFIKELFGKMAGLAAAVLYTYSPYRLLDTFLRGSIGEALSFVFLPLIFWMGYRLYQKNDDKAIVLAALGWAGLIASHNIMAMLFSPVIVIFLLILWWSKKEKRLLEKSGLILVLSLGLSCFFWLPALIDKSVVILDQITVVDFREHFLKFGQLILPGKSPFQVGLVGILSLLAGISALKFYHNDKRKIIGLFCFVFMAAIFLMVSGSAFLWDVLPFLWRTQFPWRLLALTTFAGAVLLGSAIGLIKKRPYLGLIVILATIILNYSFAKPVSFVDRGDAYYATNEATTTVKDEYLPIWVKDKPTFRPEKRVEIDNVTTTLANYEQNSRIIKVSGSSRVDSEIRLNVHYFPGWEARVNDVIKDINYINPKGIMTVKVPSGDWQVIFQFKETRMRLIADIITVVSLVISFGLLVARKNK